MGPAAISMLSKPDPGISKDLELFSTSQPKEDQDAQGHTCMDYNWASLTQEVYNNKEVTVWLADLNTIRHSSQ